MDTGDILVGAQKLKSDLNDYSIATVPKIEGECKTLLTIILFSTRYGASIVHLSPWTFCEVLYIMPSSSISLLKGTIPVVNA